MVDATDPARRCQTLEQARPCLPRRERRVGGQETRPTVGELLKRTGMGTQPRRKPPHANLREATQQDVGKCGGGLPFPAGRNVYAVYKMQVEVGIVPQSEQVIVVVGRRDGRNRDVRRLGSLCGTMPT